LWAPLSDNPYLDVGLFFAYLLFQPGLVFWFSVDRACLFLSFSFTPPLLTEFLTSALVVHSSHVFLTKSLPFLGSLPEQATCQSPPVVNHLSRCVFVAVFYASYSSLALLSAFSPPGVGEALTTAPFPFPAALAPVLQLTSSFPFFKNKTPPSFYFCVGSF